LMLPTRVDVRPRVIAASRAADKQRAGSDVAEAQRRAMLHGKSRKTAVQASGGHPRRGVLRRHRQASDDARPTTQRARKREGQPDPITRTAR